MPRPLWKGHIKFGLVIIPVGLYPAENPARRIAFRLLDRHSLAPIHNERVSDESGRVIPWEDVVKGYEYQAGKFVVVSQEDLMQANVDATQTIDILQFVKAEEIDPVFFVKPYYLAPTRHGEKGYVILREALKTTRKVGIGKVVIRTKENLAAIFPRGAALMMQTLRFAHELRSASDLEIPDENIRTLGVKKIELELAEKLIEGMTETWKPAQYRDEYRDDLLKLIQKKIKTGETKVQPPAEEPKRAKGEVIEIMDLLRRSLDEGDKPSAKARVGGGTKRQRGSGKSEKSRRSA